MDLLAVVGMISTALIAVLALLLCMRIAVRLTGLRRRGRAGERAPLPGFGASYALDLRRDAERRRWVRLFRQRYDAVCRAFAVPADAGTVVKCASAFSLEHIPLEHYAWRQGDTLYFFPKWRDIAACLADPAFLHVHTPAEADCLYGWKIPGDGLVAFQEDKGRCFTGIQYTDSRGNRCWAVLLEGGAEFLRGLFPERDRAVQERRAYLGSNQNLEDIRAEMDELAERRDSGRISAGEYELQKKQILFKL